MLLWLLRGLPVSCSGFPAVCFHIRISTVCSKANDFHSKVAVIGSLWRFLSVCLAQPPSKSEEVDYHTVFSNDHYSALCQVSDRRGVCSNTYF